MKIEQQSKNKKAYGFFTPTPQGGMLAKEYAPILLYLKNHQSLKFLDFDSAVSTKLPLCTFFSSQSLKNTDMVLKAIIKELPFLTNIFLRPLIHLKDNDITRPIDSVTRVTSKTITHLSRHAENWKGRDKDNGVAPSRLLTRIYEDDYSIYENIVFKDLIDKILHFLRRSISGLNDVLQALNMAIRPDFATRHNHRQFYIAIGKLFSGFYGVNDLPYIKELHKALSEVYGRLVPYLTRPVYAKNRLVAPISGSIKKTNILSMHKDYKHILPLWQVIEKQFPSISMQETLLLQEQAKQGYGKFCMSLLLFSATNFNFACNPLSKVFKKGALEAVLTFKDWSLSLQSVYNNILDQEVINLTISHHGKTVRYLIIPNSYYIKSNKKGAYGEIVDSLMDGNTPCDKYVFLEPFETGRTSFYSYNEKSDKQEAFYAVLPVSFSNVNSFRRLQNIILEGMVRTCTNFSHCAFCSEELTQGKDGNYLCKRCRTKVAAKECLFCGHTFVATAVDLNSPPSFYDGYNPNCSAFFASERNHLFRNITKVKDNAFECPNCKALCNN